MILHDRSRRLRAPHKAALILLGMMLLTAAVSYGFVWRAEERRNDEFRTMIYHISSAMGEIPDCFD